MQDRLTDEERKKLILRSMGEGPPTRLFVSGLHGDEHLTTDPILKKFAARISKNKPNGRVILSTLRTSSQKYMSTLERAYFKSKSGEKLLSLIKYYLPNIYLELHSYSNYSGLTDPDRIEKEGVPPLIDLGSGILAGSVSPLLRTKFRKKDFCFLLDIPQEIEDNGELLEIMEAIARSSDRNEILSKLWAKYPEQTKQMIKNYLEFYGTEGL